MFLMGYFEYVSLRSHRFCSSFSLFRKYCIKFSLQLISCIFKYKNKTSTYIALYRMFSLKKHFLRNASFEFEEFSPFNYPDGIGYIQPDCNRTKQHIDAKSLHAHYCSSICAVFIMLCLLRMRFQRNDLANVFIEFKCLNNRFLLDHCTAEVKQNIQLDEIFKSKICSYRATPLSVSNSHHKAIQNVCHITIY